mmetsp:Transcript_25440/g.83692  ORF Transcript_25440/g.83692 Transcript_25440/m.83692 type:complete len:173 (+) Transcript_25440:289-807(+)
MSGAPPPGPTPNQQVAALQAQAQAQAARAPVAATARPPAAGAAPATRPAVAKGPVIGNKCLQDILAQIAPDEKLEPEVEEVLVDIADDFIDSVITFSCSLARHRGSNTLDVKDILLHLERNWGMSIPGYGSEEVQRFTRATETEAHKQRLAAIRHSFALAAAEAQRAPAPEQ